MCNLSDLVEERGMERKLKELVEKKLAKGVSIEDIADALEESADTIQRIVCEIKGMI